MTVKLVRTDALDAVKIKLTRGEHVIGRGTLLNCDEKRISRQHGELLVNNDDSITLKALHLNPCFFLKKNSKEVEILRLGSSITLNNGDRFGLLPDTYWYEVLLEQDVDESENIQSENCTEEYLTEVNDNGQNSPCKNNDANQTRCITPDSPSVLTAQNESTENQQNLSVSSQVDQNEPKLHSQDNEAVQQIPDPNKISNPTSEIKKERDEPEGSPPFKRAHSQDNKSQDGEVKKIKTENVKEEPKSDDEKPGTSDQVTARPATVNDGGPSNTAPNRVRERCMYGANCYRKNPQHLSQFSHPRDADWGPGERGVCPYGAACLKRDPRHWRQHEHPPGTEPPPPPGMRVVERRGQIIYINAHTVNFYEDHFEVEDQDGDSVDYDYEF